MSTWRFLLDENIDPKVATYLDKEDLFAVHVRDTVGQGADDEEDVLPYAREHDLIIVTSDVKDFGALSSKLHAGIILLYDDTMPAYRVCPHYDGRYLLESGGVRRPRRTRCMGLRGRWRMRRPVID